MAHPVKIIDVVSDEDFDRFDIVRRNEVVDGMWGMSHIRITDEEIEEALIVVKG